MVNDLNSFTFDFFDKNVFYAIGATNEAFDAPNDSGERHEEFEGLDGNHGVNDQQDKQLRYSFEKFFIDTEETFQSQTLGYIELGGYN